MRLRGDGAREGEPMTGRKHAFTLIELLVVVAIIAILAAIALPNFLEAQTRAKVSRARSDIHAIVTAVETYRVDWNSYPTYHYTDFMTPNPGIEFHIGGRVPDWGEPDPDWDGRIPITTPVAYLTVFPLDPFTPYRGGVPREVREYLYVSWDYAVRQTTNPTYRNVFVFAEQVYGPYRLHSRGPDLDAPDSGLPYDPTNGTLSQGDITYGPNCGFDRLAQFPYVPFS
ncbi:prepilin-type N-terminal cleavage/methylation domain-containing protein [Candidatus Sumerlaeota bacterium]|nr:prepilin-type N-terminal cleavage/methylation domain-containing protein [Candidatus Sumerlaeota bacterium]